MLEKLTAMGFRLDVDFVLYDWGIQWLIENHPSQEEIDNYVTTPLQPRSASRAQVLITLHDMGLYAAYEQYIATAPIPVQIAAGEQTWSLDSPNIQAGIVAMGLTPEQAQQIITAANQVKV